MSDKDIPGWIVFKDWFKNQAHFPQKLDDTVLLRFLHSCYYDVEEAKKAAEIFFRMRESCPNIFSDRDPLDPGVQNAMKFCKMAHYPISGNRFLWIWQIDDPGLQRYNASDEGKLSSLVTDTWLLTEKSLEESDIIIICAKHFSFRILMKINVSLARMQLKYYEEAMPFRLKEIHFVNCPPIMNRIFSLYKTFLKPEISDRVRFHLPDSDTLFEHIHREELPKDLGGSRDSMECLTTQAIQRIMKQRNKLLDDSYWISNKNKK